jgi:hypothetical protein
VQYSLFTIPLLALVVRPRAGRELASAALAALTCPSRRRPASSVRGDVPGQTAVPSEALTYVA